MITARLFTWLALAATIPVAAASVPVAHAQRPPLLSLAQADAAVSSASHGNAHALSVFRGTDGMIGVVYRGTGGSKGIVWLTPHGGAVVTDGHLVDRQGSDLTKAAMYEQGLLLTPAAVPPELATSEQPNGNTRRSRLAIGPEDLFFCCLSLDRIRPNPRSPAGAPWIVLPVSAGRSLVDPARGVRRCARR